MGALLMSDEGAFITGQFMRVDGGRTMRPYPEGAGSPLANAVLRQIPDGTTREVEMSFVIDAKSPIPPKITRMLGVVGGLFVIYQLACYLIWMLSPGFAPAPRGDSPISADILAGVRFGQMTQIVGAAVWSLFLIISWLKVRRLTWPMALSVGWIAVYWQDPLINIWHHDFSYNAYLFNKGDWTPYLPLLPHGGSTLLQPILLQGSVFYWQIPVFALLTNWLMIWARRGLGIQKGWILFAIGWGGMVIVDFLLETRGIQTRVFAWNRVDRTLSLHAGTPEQWPLYEGIMVAMMWASGGILHFFRGTNRFTPFDRSTTEEGPFSGLWLVLVLIGFFNVIFLGYNAVLVILGGFNPTIADFPSWLNGAGGN